MTLKNLHLKKRYCLKTKRGKAFLTERELACLYHAMHCRTAKQIGIVLSLSARTVEYHLYKVRKKLGCCNRVELMETILVNLTFKRFIELSTINKGAIE